MLDNKNNIFKHHFGEKSNRHSLLTYVDFKMMLEKMDNCENNQENLLQPLQTIIHLFWFYQVSI